MSARTIGAILGCAAAMLSLVSAANAEPHRRYQQASAYGESPVYWGVERRVLTYRNCCGWRWTRLNSRDASIHQLNPHLRARRDGRLLEEIGTPPPSQPEAVMIWPDGSSAGQVIPPWAFRWYGFKHGHRHPHSPASAGSKLSGSSGSLKKAH